MCREYGFLDHFLTSAKTGKNLKQCVDSLLLGVGYTITVNSIVII